jgi:hypothetical protein
MPRPELLTTDTLSRETSDWVDCPVCGESDMTKTTNEYGNSFIRCVNHVCASNGGTNSSRLDEQRAATIPASTAAPGALTLKQALRAEEAGGILTGMSSSRAAVILAQTDVMVQPLLHKVMTAALMNALAMEELGRVLEHVRNESEGLCEAQPGTMVNG